MPEDRVNAVGWDTRQGKSGYGDAVPTARVRAPLDGT